MIDEKEGGGMRGALFIKRMRLAGLFIKQGVVTSNTSPLLKKTSAQEAICPSTRNRDKKKEACRLE